MKQHQLLFLLNTIPVLQKMIKRSVYIVLFFMSFFTTAQTQLGVDIDGEAVGDQCGHSVSISSDGTRVAIGAPYNDGNGNGSGHVRVYEYSGGAWSQLGVDIDGEAASDQSGHSVSISSDGTRVAIGARFNAASGGSSGHVRVYEYNGGTWTQLGADIDGEAAIDNSGYSVSLSSDGVRVAIGAPQNDGNGSNSGHVRVYEYSGGTWSQLGADIDGETVGNQSGHSVSLSSDGTRVASGAYLNDGNGNASGNVRVYEYSGGTWNQLGADIDGEAAGDVSGYSVSLSSDGTRIAIGAPQNDGNGTISGHIRLYEYSGGSWGQLGSDINGEAVGDILGFSVSLSSDGTRVATGAPRNKGNGNDSGHVRVYSVNTLSTNNIELVSENIQLYPNPTEKYISLSNLKKDQNYTIYNILGIQVKKGTILNNENIDVRYFLKGMYLLKLDNGNTFKFFKK